MRSISASSCAISCSAWGESVVLLSSAPCASAPKVTATMAAATDKTARCGLRANGSENRMRALAVGTGASACGGSAVFQFQQRPRIPCKERSAILTLVPGPIVCGCGHEQQSGSAHENLNPKRIQAGLDRGMGTK